MVELRQLVVDHLVRAFLPVVARGLTAKAPQHLLIIEALGVLCVVAVLAAEPRCQGQQHRNVADHRVDVPFHQLISVGIGRAVAQHVAFLVLNLVADVGHQHLGVTHAGGLVQVEHPNQVIAHRVEDRHLKRGRHPAALLVGGLRRQIEMRVGPLHRCQRRLFVQCIESPSNGVSQRPHPGWRCSHPKSPVWLRTTQQPRYA